MEYARLGAGMAENEDTPDDVAESQEPSWPLAEQLAKLEALDLDEIRGRNRLGDLAFENAPDQIARIIKILTALRTEEWDLVPADVGGQVISQINELLGLVEQMRELSSSDPNASASSAQLSQRLTEINDFFRDRVWPLCVDARVSESLGRRASTEEMEQKVGDLEQRAQVLTTEIERLAPLVESQRQAVGESGAEDLAVFFENQANDHAEACKWPWGVALACSVLGAVGFGILTLWLAHPPNGASNARIVTGFGIGLLVVGLLVYVVRFTSLQFRAHRHMEAVARNKAAALRTFTRISSGVADAETRSAIAITLAQAVFDSTETVFADSSGDQVTVIDRALPFFSRLPPAQ
jgi:hypothetical protein